MSTIDVPVMQSTPARQALAGDGEVLIEGRDIGLRRDSRWILEHVDIAVRRGEIVTIVGPNGAGKTTLVHVLLGLETPDSGSVYRKPGLAIGFAPQRLVLNPAMPLTCRRFLTLGRVLGDAGLRQRLAEVGLDDVLDRQVLALSGGEFHRLLLARALLRDPELLVLDEPLSGVDLAGQTELYRLIAETRERRGCGILLVSHDLHLVLRATDRVICLEGRVCCAGTPVDITREADFQRLFGSAFAETFAAYRHRHADACGTVDEEPRRK